MVPEPKMSIFESNPVDLRDKIYVKITNPLELEIKKENFIKFYKKSNSKAYQVLMYFVDPYSILLFFYCRRLVSKIS